MTTSWKVFDAWQNNDGLIIFSRIGNEEKNIIKPVTFNDEIQATEADLNLICAAPELLEACEAALGLTEIMNEGDLYDQIKRAIAKAKGE